MNGEQVKAQLINGGIAGARVGTPALLVFVAYLLLQILEKLDRALLLLEMLRAR